MRSLTSTVTARTARGALTPTTNSFTLLLIPLPPIPVPSQVFSGMPYGATLPAQQMYPTFRLIEERRLPTSLIRLKRYGYSIVRTRRRR